jgi:hypothetical protein
MTNHPPFDPVYQRLVAILQPYVNRLHLIADRPGFFYLETAYTEKWKKPLFFASVQVKKNYVSFYLMPVYMFTDLLEGVSPALRKRMQGKSCFNFKRIDESLFAELESLTLLGFQRFQSEQYV